MKSILHSSDRCFLCGERGQLEEHHIFFGNPGRKISEKHGFKIRLCPYCHRLNPNAPHRNRTTDLELKRICQKAYEEQGNTREEFIALIGRNYL